ncbi:MAG: winged helix-turn-helix domain-containing protein [Minisyncoccia bacterium]
MKTPKQLERYFKGSANHIRISILILLNKTSDKTLEDISDSLEKNIKTVSEHTRRLVQAGLINKKYIGRFVVHSLSPYGQKFVKFISTF